MVKTPQSKQASLAGKTKAATIKFDSSPMKQKKKKWGNDVDVYQTMIDILVVIITTRCNNAEGAYITPMTEAFEEDPTGDLAREWKVLGIFPRRGSDGSSEMTKGPSNNYKWECLVAYKEDDDDTPVSLAKNIANKFTMFTRTSEKVRRGQPLHNSVPAWLKYELITVSVQKGNPFPLREEHPGASAPQQLPS